MSDEISYFQAVSFLAEIETEDFTDPTERTIWLVSQLREEWPALTTEQAVAYVKLFEAG